MVGVRGRARLLALLALVALLVAWPTSVATAHSDLTSSDPEDGAVLTEAPESISFTFSEDLLAQGNAITLTETESGDRLDLAQAGVDGDTVSVPWPADAPSGEYRASFRVVSADGHPIDGSITFTVEQASSSATTTPTPTPTPSTPPSASPSPVTDTQDASMLVWVLGLGVVVLAGVGGATFYARRSR